MSSRFYESPPWRFVLTDLDSVTLTFLDRLVGDRRITKTLNAPMVIEGQVPSDDPEIFIVHTDSDPFLHEGNRLLYCFRREDEAIGSGVANWICRAAGIVLETDDNGDANVPRTEFVAYDPWQLLYRRPVIDANGDLPGENGFSYNDPGNEIAFGLLDFTDIYHGTTHIDYTTGTFETTEDVEFDLQQGASVGEAFDQLVETGTMDIVLEPVYDPVGRPGITSQLNIYARAGQSRPGAIFAWDKPSRSLVNLSRHRNGNERANRLQYYIGQGGPPVPLVSSAPAIAKFGEYWDQQFFPSHQSSATVEAIAKAQRRIRRFGLVHHEMSPAPERSPIPFVDYDIGDTVPIYASGRLREPVAAEKRVQSIPLVIGNDQMEAPANVVLANEEDEPA